MDFALSMQHACPFVNGGCRSWMLGSFLWYWTGTHTEKRRSTGLSHQADKRNLVHIRGPIKHDCKNQIELSFTTPLAVARMPTRWKTILRIRLVAVH